ncbi:hypothetical protein [Salinirubrum litoreum]|uniref:Uncharacterized protein n=1 Tax=Salinirubrum litoreum TaxID=1126234 RepID=A0ABD5RAA1_9EURY|nr:hypothetical protein [Salinirubrum litoreum]
MKFKLVPPAPDSLDFVRQAQQAVPLVPGSEDDCCARLLRRTGLPARDDARTWLTFLRALELATETDAGFKRLSQEPTPEQLRDAFVRRVFGVEELLATLREAEDPITTEEAFARLRERVPQWEHYKNPTEWKDIWQERTGDLLDWLVLLNAAVETDEGYRLVADPVGGGEQTGVDS